MCFVASALKNFQEDKVAKHDFQRVNGRKQLDLR